MVINSTILLVTRYVDDILVCSLDELEITRDKERVLELAVNLYSNLYLD